MSTVQKTLSLRVFKGVSESSVDKKPLTQAKNGRAFLALFASDGRCSRVPRSQVDFDSIAFVRISAVVLKMSSIPNSRPSPPISMLKDNVIVHIFTLIVICTKFCN